MSCTVERSSKASEINAMLAGGLGFLTIEKRLRAEGVPIKRETIKRHLEICLPSAAVDSVRGEEPLTVVDAADVRRLRAENPNPRDFASMVQRRAVQALEADELKVSTRDGLAAQALLDRRADRDQDRQFMLDLARLLSGGGRGAPAELCVGAEIEGVFVEATSGGHPID